MDLLKGFDKVCGLEQTDGMGLTELPDHRSLQGMTYDDNNPMFLTNCRSTALRTFQTTLGWTAWIPSKW